MKENNFKTSESAGDLSEAQRKQKEMLIYQEIAKGKMRIFFDSYKNGKDRIENLKKVNAESLSLLENREDIEKALDMCESIDSRDEFAEKVSEILKPIFDVLIDEHFQKNVGAEKKWLLNEVLSYTVEGDVVQIHIFFGKKEYSLAQKTIEGLEKLAQFVDKNPNIKTIEAISWIVSEYPKLIEKKMGFIIGGDVDPEYIREHFEGDDREIKRAYMTREDFLNKYLNK